MADKRPRTPQDDPRSSEMDGRAVWDSRDRYEAAEARVRDLEAQVAMLQRLLLVHGIDDPMLGTGRKVKRT